MQSTKFKSIEIEGVIFDGTFEASVDIANFLKEAVQGKVSKFAINHFATGSRLGETNITFTLRPNRRDDPNAKAEELTLYVGDLLRIQPSNIEVIRKRLLDRYWEGPQR